MCRWQFVPQLVVLMSLCLQLSRGHFSLYVTQAEMKRLTGLSSEIYYVQNGVINTYAINFDVPVQGNISHLEFHWFSQIRRSLPYQWSYEYNNRAAMKKPTFNISTRGILPTKDSTFQVRLDCTGEVTAEVRVLLYLNVSAVSHRHNETFLTFRRNKICLKRTDGQTDGGGANVIPSMAGSGEGGIERQQQQQQQQQQPPRKQSNNPSAAVTSTMMMMTTTTTTTTTTAATATSVSVIEETNEVMAKSKGTSGRVSAETTVPQKSDDNLVFYISLAGLCGLLIVVFVVIFYLSFVHSYLGLNKLGLSRSRDSVQTSYTSAAYAPNPSVFVRLASTKSGNYATISSLHKHPTYVSPYATSYITPESIYRGLPQKEEHIYSNPETSSKISYYASCQLLHSPMKCERRSSRGRERGYTAQTIVLSRLLRPWPESSEEDGEKVFVENLR